MRRFISLPNAVFALLFVLLVYTRFVGLDWGLPYPMHPDERNMVMAIQNMQCTPGDVLSCFDPQFWAYGQFPLFIGYLLSHLLQLFSQNQSVLTSEVITIALRLISAVASVVMSVFIYKTIQTIRPLRRSEHYMVLLLIVFVPAFIQFSHFGTTESLLMMFVTLMMYEGVKFLHQKMSWRNYVKTTGILFGLALGTKISAVLFAVIPIWIAGSYFFRDRSWKRLGMAWFELMKIAALSTLFFILTSPYNILGWGGFINSMNYESSVGLGTYKAFYTRSFEYTIPVIFQLVRVFPYALGWPLFALGIVGFIFLSWKNTYHIMLRIILLVTFLGSALMYAKWTRFIAPVFPLMVLFAILAILRVSSLKFGFGSIRKLGIGNWILVILFILSLLPGIAYLSIYQKPDVRFVASKWIYENIEPGSKILSETANVVDVPMPNQLVSNDLVYASDLHPISFDFYEVDNNKDLEDELAQHLKDVEYIFVPSRRIFWNHTCYTPISNTQFQISNYSWMNGFSSDRCGDLEKKYPVLQAYYTGLFDGSLGFEKVAEFTSYPRIELFGRTILAFPDEAAEETWSVFDHPVVRVYKRI